jgi:signal transduction histidine kinase
MLSSLLDACSDELQVLVSESLEEKDIIIRLRQHIEKLFGPHDARSEEVRLDQFVEKRIQALRPRFTHRKCRVNVLISAVPAVWIPREVLAKIVDGLVRNAVENTPDSGNITVSVRSGEIGPELEVKDNGIGISDENQRLLFDNYFTAYDTMQYSSRNPYDFGAGGKGFDLLRMRIFSERYHFELKMNSRRCDVIPADADACPGNLAECVQAEGCLESGGTTVTVQFYPADRFDKSNGKSD